MILTFTGSRTKSPTKDESSRHKEEQIKARIKDLDEKISKGK